MKDRQIAITEGRKSKSRFVSHVYLTFLLLWWRFRRFKKLVSSGPRSLWSVSRRAGGGTTVWLILMVPSMFML